MTQLIADLVDLILAAGAMLYAYKMTATAKGGVLERGMRVMTLSLLFLLLSIIADMVGDLRFVSGGVSDTAHDLILAVFILLTFFGLMAMVRDASQFIKLVRP